MPAPAPDATSPVAAGSVSRAIAGLWTLSPRFRGLLGQLTKFALVGGVGFALDLTVFNVFHPAWSRRPVAEPVEAR